ncbi:UNVERIFIED_CONTAM: hypothetical protein RMT77_003298 [Armadillidium vulgare]
MIKIYFFSSLIIAFKIVNTDTEIRHSTFAIDNCTCGLQKGVRDKEGRIYGGVLEEEAEFPWLVAIFSRESFFCGGTLINEKYIVSAAHCFKTYSKSEKKAKYSKVNNIRIILGTTNIDSLSALLNNETISFQIRALSYIIIHPNYNPRFLHYDVSLIRMRHDLQEFSRTIFPICLPPLRYSFENVEAFITGWGYINSKSGAVNNARKADVKVFPDRECKKKLKAYYKKEFMICAAHPMKDTCSGDSGGPLMTKLNDHQYILIGVTSFGLLGCGKLEKPGVYTRMSTIVPWIKKLTQDATYCRY